MSNKILVICPSRNRPENIQALYETWCETTAGFSDLIVALDVDNQAQYPRIENVLYEVNPRIRMVPTLNLVAKKYCEYWDGIGFVGDDHRFRTFGWDEEFMNYINADKNAIVYGNDLFQGANLPTAVFLNANIVRKLGYMVPETLVHMYADNFWRDIGTALNSLVYRDDIIIEHCHPVVGKAESDAQYVEVDQYMGPDAERYAEYCATQMTVDLEKLR